MPAYDDKSFVLAAISYLNSKEILELKDEPLATLLAKTTQLLNTLQADTTNTKYRRPKSKGARRQSERARQALIKQKSKQNSGSSMSSQNPPVPPVSHNSPHPASNVPPITSNNPLPSVGNRPDSSSNDPPRISVNSLFNNAEAH
ncbi:hypothetical protein EV361DRAFT_866036 [Lentinula raphanica]|nr:hypothetical protein EV361DRAFT_866036 [Lentinula raphanica]